MNQRYWFRFLLCLLITASIVPAAQAVMPWSGIVDSGRAIDWSQTGIPGGIPNRTAICATIDKATYGNDTADATDVIQGALNSCPANEVVYVPAGTYRIDGNLSVPSHVTLRGAGPQQTVLDAHGAGQAVISFGTSVNPYSANSIAILSGTSQGSNIITLGSAGGLAVGTYLLITELNDSNFVTDVGGGGTCTWCDGGIGWNGTRVLGQIVEVTSVNGTAVGISPSLYLTYQGSLSPLATPFTAGAKDAGVEDLQVYANNTGYAANFVMSGSAYCWIKDIESNYADGDHVDVYWSYRGEIRDSHFHDAFLHTPGAYDSDVDLIDKTSGFLVDNNIFRRLHVSIMLEWGAAGNVVAYNYAEGEFDVNATNVLMGSIDEHGAHPMFNLMEGNIVSAFGQDSIWGSQSDDTAFRNWFKGTTQICNPLSGRGALGTCWWAVQANRAVSPMYLARDNNYVSNVIGSNDLLKLTHYNDGIRVLPMATKIVAPATRSYDATTYGYSFGYGGGGGGDDGSWPGDNALPFTTAFIHGDYNYADGSTTWDPTVIDHPLPPSFYLSAKPPWFGSLVWPPIGADVAGLNNDIPASYCYAQGLMPNCLTSGAPPPPSPPPGNRGTIFSPRVYPNPWRSDRGYAQQITFDQLRGNTTVKIFTVSGDLIKTLTSTIDTATWHLTNNSGDKVGGGIYIYLITDSWGDKMRGKVAIIK